MVKWIKFPTNILWGTLLDIWMVTFFVLDGIVDMKHHDYSGVLIDLWGAVGLQAVAFVIFLIALIVAYVKNHKSKKHID